MGTVEPQGIICLCVSVTCSEVNLLILLYVESTFGEQAAQALFKEVASQSESLLPCRFNWRGESTPLTLRELVCKHAIP